MVLVVMDRPTSLGENLNRPDRKKEQAVTRCRKSLGAQEVEGGMEEGYSRGLLGGKASIWTSSKGQQPLVLLNRNGLYESPGEEPSVIIADNTHKRKKKEPNRKSKKKHSSCRSKSSKSSSKEKVKESSRTKESKSKTKSQRHRHQVSTPITDKSIDFNVGDMEKNITSDFPIGMRSSVVDWVKRVKMYVDNLLIIITTTEHAQMIREKPMGITPIKSVITTSKWITTSTPETLVLDDDIEIPLEMFTHRMPDVRLLDPPQSAQKFAYIQPKRTTEKTRSKTTATMQMVTTKDDEEVESGDSEGEESDEEEEEVNSSGKAATLTESTPSDEETTSAGTTKKEEQSTSGKTVAVSRTTTTVKVRTSTEEEEDEEEEDEEESKDDEEEEEKTKSTSTVSHITSKIRKASSSKPTTAVHSSTVKGQGNSSEELSKNQKLFTPPYCYPYMMPPLPYPRYMPPPYPYANPYENYPSMKRNHLNQHPK